jgi:hypothetical protein
MRLPPVFDLNGDIHCGEIRKFCSLQDGGRSWMRASLT